MKSAKLTGFLAFILLLVGCGDNGLNEQGFADAIKTLTAAASTATFTITPRPDENAIVALLNRAVQDSIDPLSETVEAKYTVDNIDFLPGPDMNLGAFLVEIHCECSRNDSCCSPNHMFLVVIQAMKTKPDKIIEMIPHTISDFQVSCYDHEKSIGIVSFPWRPVREYLTGQVNGYQLGGMINKYLATGTLP